MRRALCAGPVGAPYLVCRVCGRAHSMWMPDCPSCARLRDGAIAPVVGEKFIDVLAERRVEGDDP